MLYLPEIKDAQTIIIYNMTNEEIWKTGHCICRGCCA